MEVQLLYFAAVADAVGRAEERRTLPAAVRTLTALRAYLRQEYPALEPGLPHVRFAKNEVFARDEETIAAGDVIALIPPVAGG